MVNACVDGIELRLVRRKFVAQNAMNLLDTVFVEIAASDPGLIGDDDCLHTVLINLSNRRTGPGKNLVQAGMIHVADFFRNGSVTIHEHRAIHISQ